jgi:hypothetical protein
MSDYKIQVCKPYEKGDWRGYYRFMIIDSKDCRGYPANYVCMLPQRICDKGKPLSVFAKKFGDNSVAYAGELLKEAIQREKDNQAKSELEKRLKSLTSSYSLNLTKKAPLIRNYLKKIA